MSSSAVRGRSVREPRVLLPWQPVVMHVTHGSHGPLIPSSLHSCPPIGHQEGLKWTQGTARKAQSSRLLSLVTAGKKVSKVENEFQKNLHGKKLFTTNFWAIDRVLGDSLFAQSDPLLAVTRERERKHWLATNTFRGFHPCTDFYETYFFFLERERSPSSLISHARPMASFSQDFSSKKNGYFHKSTRLWVLNSFKTSRRLRVGSLPVRLAVTR